MLAIISSCPNFSGDKVRAATTSDLPLSYFRNSILGILGDESGANMHDANSGPGRLLWCPRISRFLNVHWWRGIVALAYQPSHQKLNSS